MGAIHGRHLEHTRPLHPPLHLWQAREIMPHVFSTLQGVSACTQTAAAANGPMEDPYKMLERY